MITGIVSDLGGNTTIATWPVFDWLYIFATASPAVAALNLIGSSFSVVTHGSPSFAPDQGYTGIASAYLDTQLNPNSGGVNFVEDNASVWVWSLTNFASGTDYGPALQCLSTVRLYPHYSDNHFYNGINNASFDYQPISAGHFYGASRSISTGYTAYVDTASQAVSDSSVLLPTSNVFLLAADGTGSSPFTANLAAAALGSSVTGTQQGFLYARFHKFMQDVAGAP